jgi:hypothetical protein
MEAVSRSAASHKWPFAFVRSSILKLKGNVAQNYLFIATSNAT